MHACLAGPVQAIALRVVVTSFIPFLGVSVVPWSHTAVYMCLISTEHTHTQHPSLEKRVCFVLHLSDDSFSLRLSRAGLSVSDGFVATPFMGARVGGTSAVINGMSMVSEREEQRGGEKHDSTM